MATVFIKGEDISAVHSDYGVIMLWSLAVMVSSNMML